MCVQMGLSIPNGEELSTCPLRLREWSARLRLGECKRHARTWEEVSDVYIFHSAQGSGLSFPWSHCILSGFTHH